MPATVVYWRNVIFGILFSSTVSCTDSIKECNQHPKPSIYEEAPAGTFVTIVHPKQCTICAAVPPPRPSENTFFKMMNLEDGGYFKIDLISGLLTTKKKIDRKLGDKYKIMVLILENGETKILQINIDVTIYNSFAPKFKKDLYRTLVYVDIPLGTSIIQIEATDEDSFDYNSEIRYSLDKRYIASSYFTANEDTGSISITRRPLDKSESFVKYKVFAYNCGSPLRFAQVWVEVLFTSGSDCKEIFCHYGVCKTTDNDGGYVCHCHEGYTGKECDSLVSCEKTPCLNYGTCMREVPDSNGTVTAGEKCICHPGFLGLRCEKNTHNCSNDPCMNGGTCEDLENGYRCLCNSVYEGMMCEIKTRCEKEVVEVEGGTLVWEETSPGGTAIYNCVDTGNRATRECLSFTNGTAYWNKWSDNCFLVPKSDNSTLIADNEILTTINEGLTNTSLQF